MIRTPLRLFPPILALAALAACASGPDPKAAVTPTEQFPLKTAAQPDELRLAPHPGGLSAAQAAALDDLAARWRARGGGSIVVRAPLSGADPKASSATSAASREALIADGVPASQVEEVGYDPAGDALAPVIVGFLAYDAVVPQCGRHWDNLTATGSNRPYANFGCAVSANMAAQIVDPADIAGPRAETPPDAGTRTAAIDAARQASSGGSSSGSSGSSSSGSSGASGSSSSGSGASGSSSSGTP